MRLIFGTIVISALLSGVLTSPSSRRTPIKRDLDCVWDNVGAPVGVFFAVGSDGTNLDCDDVQEYASSDNGVSCYMTNDDPDSLGTPVKCPRDPAPKKNPDGSDAEVVAGGFISTWCDTVDGGTLPVKFASTAACFLFGYYEARGNPVKEAEAGAVALCDAIFSGICTWFIDMEPLLADAMSKPCVDDPDSNACEFASMDRK